MLGFTSKLLSLQWDNQNLQSHQKFTCWLMNKLQYLRHYTLQKFANDLLMTLISFLYERTLVDKLHRNIKFTIEEESNGKLVFLGTL